MRRLTPALFALLLPAFVTGCAITNYPVITDADQTSSSAGEHVVNTSGEAIIIPEMQMVTLHPDGADELLTWVDQDSKGNQVLYTRNNFCAVDEPCFASMEWFAGMTYVNPDRTGCWIWRAPNPVDGDVDIFDGDFNPNCKGARSLFLLYSTTVRSGEGGKDARAGHGAKGDGGDVAGSSVLDQTFAGVSVPDAVQALGRLSSLGDYGDHTAEYGLHGWRFDLTPDNFDVRLGDDRFLIEHLVTVFDLRNGRLVVDARTGNTADMLYQLADWVDLNGNESTLTVSFAGISPSFEVGLMPSDHYREMAARLE